MSKKIDLTYLNEVEKLGKDTIINKFGSWTSRIDELKSAFIHGVPFEHIVIDNFLSDDYVEEIHNLFPTNYESWYTYTNPLEVKFAYDNINVLNVNLKNYFYYLSSAPMIDLMKEITTIGNLEMDEYLHGRLNVHLDYKNYFLFNL